MRRHSEYTLDAEPFIVKVREQLAQLPDDVQLFDLLNPDLFSGDPAVKNQIDAWTTFHAGLPQKEQSQLTRILNALIKVTPKSAHDPEVGRVVYDASQTEGNTLGLFRAMTAAKFQREYNYDRLGFNSIDFVIDIGLIQAMSEADSRE